MHKRIASLTAIVIALAGGLIPLTTAAKEMKDDAAAVVERGRYLVKTTLCVACHSTGYEMSAGRLPEAQWLTGNQRGFAGPWGTTYPINLRLYMQPLSADEWLKAAYNMTARPPMQWYVVRDERRGPASHLRFHQDVEPAGQSGAGVPATGGGDGGTSVIRGMCRPA